MYDRVAAGGKGQREVGTLLVHGKPRRLQECIEHHIRGLNEKL